MKQIHYFTMYVVVWFLTLGFVVLNSSCTNPTTSEIKEVIVADYISVKIYNNAYGGQYKDVLISDMYKVIHIGIPPFIINVEKQTQIEAQFIVYNSSNFVNNHPECECEKDVDDSRIQHCEEKWIVNDTTWTIAKGTL